MRTRLLLDSVRLLGSINRTVQIIASIASTTYLKLSVSIVKGIVYYSSRQGEILKVSKSSIQIKLFTSLIKRHKYQRAIATF